MTPNARKCVAVRELLNDRLDHRLEASRAPEVDAHVRTCRSCASYDRGLRALRRSLRTVPRVTAPAGRVSAGVMRRIDRRRSMTRGRASLWVSGLAAAALVFVVAAMRDSSAPNPQIPIGSGIEGAATESLVQTTSPPIVDMREREVATEVANSTERGADEGRTVADAARSDATEGRDARTTFEDPADGESGDPAISEATSSAGAGTLPSGVSSTVLRATQLVNAIDTTKAEMPKDVDDTRDSVDTDGR